MVFDDRPYTLDRIVRIVLSVGLVWGLVLLLGYLSSVLLPFVVALVAAYLLNPTVVYVERWTRSRGVAILITLVSLALVLFLSMWILVPHVISEIANLSRLVTDLLGDTDLARKAAERLPPDLWQGVKDFMGSMQVRDYLDPAGLAALAKQASQRILPTLMKVFSGAANILSGLMVVFTFVLYLVFLLMDFGGLRRGWRAWVPESMRGRVSEFADEFSDTMNRYFRTQALIAFIVGVLFSIGFSIIGLPLAIVLGMLIGLLNMVPYLQIAGLVPAFILAGFGAIQTGDSFWGGILGSLVVFAVVQILQDAVLVPRLQGKSMGLKPWVILLSLSVWGKLLGFMGLLLAIPLSCLLTAFYGRYVLRPQAESALESESEAELNGSTK